MQINLLEQENIYRYECNNNGNNDNKCIIVSIKDLNTSINPDNLLKLFKKFTSNHFKMKH